MDAQEQLQEVVHRTPLQTSTTFNERTGQHVYLKMENQQKTGAFKVRGASYKVACLTEEEAACGVIAASAGNHAQGVAVAAAKRGITAQIFMPEGTPQAKVEATEGYGATVVLTGESFQEAYQAARIEQERSGATFLHPFDDYEVMAGQATVAVEMLQQQPDLERLFVPIGGGGLISGVAFAAKQLKPDITVIGVQSAKAPSTYNALYKKGPAKLTSVSTIADGIAVKEHGRLTYTCIQKYVDQVITVEEHEIAQAMLLLLEREKTLVEGAGATALAGLLRSCHTFEQQQCGVVLSGGNMDLSRLPLVRKLASPKKVVIA
ncbi:threonine ammonia-lyase [Halobacillus litoralis]|uniref:L-threonine dehydratase catabolic TdcB n=1 Tax=Halobacillus litoralis TaxID=45668 RepID=A0A845DM86_9BACI|nr:MULTISPECIES: threonine ammonia-lyase [Halobacillus]MCA1022415.1 threonine ammonia-lyase [Halobacillus litoralis]MYL18536.1 threonine ammonia-lyase [Halobacillus litoralis]MYL30455.1 threonine ammonia-lyase [Halobacillus halophilus]MYL38823.1 threonine ammonia-lyase [Halobacillus litoralis]